MFIIKAVPPPVKRFLRTDRNPAENGLILQRNSVSVGRNGTRQNLDSFDQTPNLAGQRQNAAAEHRNQQLCNRLAGITQIEVVDTKGTEENPQQTGRHLGFLHPNRNRLRKRNATLCAHRRAGNALSAAIRTEILPLPAAIRR